MGKSKVPKAGKQRIQNRGRVRRHRPRMLQSDLEYRQRKHLLAKTAHYLDDNTPPVSDNEVLPRSSSSASSRKLAGRKQIRKDRAKAYRRLQEATCKIEKLDRKANKYKKRLQRFKTISGYEKTIRRSSRQESTSSLENLIETFDKQIKPFKEHFFFMKHQIRELKKKKYKVLENEIVILSLDILSATSFVRNLSKKSKVKLWPVPTSEVEFLKKEVPKKLTVVPNIMNLHQITGSK
ncbi:hypothetical protein ILUMI_18766 [Ignelater luminosus]|uniref:Uncharacterized protein n=1 Tax=Ignelater luminosus TaxID=2038154 RepID=A0A8K0CKN5_IGNLU|nr:hypothetical protein ILUMI_18766 [Ignelater luminosus]